MNVHLAIQALKTNVPHWQGGIVEKNELCPVAKDN